MFLFQLLLNDPVQFLLMVLILVVPLLISITFHEWAHGFVAYKFGDPTPKMAGRLTLNPFAHLDLVGTLMLFLVGIGWAKPVPINPLNIPSKTHQMLVAVAGPLSNVLLAVIFSFVSVFLTTCCKAQITGVYSILPVTVDLIVRINLILALFNMIPIPPLDGSRVVAWVLPEDLAYKYYYFEPYGIALIFVILFSGGFNFILNAVTFLQSKLAELINVFVFGNLF